MSGAISIFLSVVIAISIFSLNLSYKILLDIGWKLLVIWHLTSESEMLWAWAS